MHSSKNKICQHKEYSHRWNLCTAHFGSPSHIALSLCRFLLLLLRSSRTVSAWMCATAAVIFYKSHFLPPFPWRSPSFNVVKSTPNHFHTENIARRGKRMRKNTLELENFLLRFEEKFVKYCWKTEEERQEAEDGNTRFGKYIFRVKIFMFILFNDGKWARSMQWQETNDKIRLEIRRFCLTTFEINFFLCYVQ